MKTILVVDDRAVNRQFLASLLGYFQYRILEAGDGIEALEVARASRPDLVIADILMPRMDGLELVSKIRADPSLAPAVVIFYSATYRIVETRRLAAKYGVSHVIGKPAAPELILKTVAEALGEPAIPTVPATLPIPSNPAAHQFTEQFLRTVESMETVSLRLSAIIELCLDLTAERDPQRLLDRFCRAARDVLNARYAAAVVSDGGGGRIGGFAACGYDAVTETELRAAAMRGELLKEAPIAKHPIRRSVADDDPHALGLVATHPPARSLLATSLHFGERDLGWLYVVDNVGKAAFSEEDERIANTLAALAAVTYENACLYDELRAHAGKLRLEISERQMVEEMLRSREAELAGLAANHPGILFRRVSSSEGNATFSFISDRTFEVSGYAAHEFKKDPNLFTSMVVADDRAPLQRAFVRSARELTPMGFDFRFTARNGDEKWARMIATPRRLPNGDTVWDGIILDITQQKHLEREHQLLEMQLQQSHKLEAVGTLTGGMAHDFNNLLQVILGNLSILGERLRDDLPNARLANEGMDAAERGAELIRRLLAFSRRQALEPSAFDMGDLVKSMMRLLEQTLGEQIEVVLLIARDLWPAFADPSQVESAIANLAVNARDAMPKGGQLAVSVGNCTLDAAYGATHPEAAPGDYVLLEVADTGTGMSSDAQARAFEPFFTTKKDGKGTGLGLSMIYGFAKQSGGHVTLSSEEGRGTTLRLYIPRAKRASPVATVHCPTTTPPPAAMGECILVVDDKAAPRQTAVMLLSSLGYRVLEAQSPRDALHLLAAEEEIDLLFTDIIMPGGTDGVELAKQATARRPALKVLLTSGFPETRSRTSSHLPSDWALLPKPYRRDALAQKVREVLDAGHSPSPKHIVKHLGGKAGTTQNSPATVNPAEPS